MRRTVLIAAAALAIAGACLALVFFKKTPALRAAQDPSITLYWGEDFTGRSITLTTSSYDLPTGVYPETGAQYNWNDQVRSIVVWGGTWRIYENGRCNTQLDDTRIEALNVRDKPPAEGWSTLLSATSQGPLQIPNAKVGGFAQEISSVELISPENLPDWASDMRK